MRRFARVLQALAAWLALAAAAPFDPVVPGTPLAFPHDRGAHPGHRIEWWYVTGHLREAGAGAAATTRGFQVTFFRVRNPDAEAMRSRFRPEQLLFAHAALAEPARGKLLHDQRSARLMPPLVEARIGETDLRLDDWTLVRDASGYRARVPADTFVLDLAMTPTQPALLQGDRGFSRKGPSPAHASYYYSEPQLRVRGRVEAGGRAVEVEGVAWLDHEWSSELLAAEASGWDWLGANLDDGGALTVFRIRDRQGATLWASSTARDAAGALTQAGAQAVAFEPRRRWRSPRTGLEYPVEMEVRAGARAWRLKPLMDDQELDARASTGTVYWEGAVTLEPATPGAPEGRGYLELTGYGERVPF